MNEAVLITLGKILENQAAILCALMGNEKSEVMRAIIERNVRGTESVMEALKIILDGPEGGEEGNADAQDQAE
jgi:hypothetical protein